MVGSRPDRQDRSMREGEDDSAGGLPALLAEYGRLAAGLPAASPEQVRRVHERLSELDVAIDGWARELDTRRL